MHSSIRVYLVALLTTVVVLGAENKATAGVAAEPDELADGSDEMLKERQTNSYEAAVELFGLATPLNTGNAVTLGYHLSRDSLIEINAAFATVARTGQATIITDLDLHDLFLQGEGKSSLVSVRYKQFLGRSFYVHGGVGDRTSHETVYDNASAQIPMSYTKIATIDTHDVGVTGAIGSQWQWRHVTAGCDWLGFYVPLLRLKSSVANEPGLASPDVEAGQAGRVQRGLDSANVQGMRIYLGAVF